MRSLTRSRRTAVQQQLDSGLSGVGTGIGTIRERGQGAVDALAPKIEQAKETLAPRIEAAREAAGQALVDAGEWAAPRLETARDQAVTTVREKVAPAVSKAVTQAAVASAPTLHEAKTRADAALAAIRGEVSPPKRRRRWHRVSFLLAAGAASGVVAALVVRRKEPPFTPYEPISGGADPYAQPTTMQPPAEPIASLEDEIAGNLNPAPPEPIATPPAAPMEDTTPVEDTRPVEDTTVDVTDDATGETAGTGGRHRKRTRRGEPQE